MQAGNGSGDSGGPLFEVLPDGSLRQIGVLAVFQPPADGTIRYGSISGWTSVQDSMPWLTANNPLRFVSARAGAVAWSDRTAWSEGEVPDNRAGSLLGPPGQAGRFFNVQLTEPGNVGLDINATIDGLNVRGGRSALDIAANRTLQVITGSQMEAGRLAVNGTLGTPNLQMFGGILSGTGRIRILDFGVANLPFGVANFGGTVAPGGARDVGVLTVGVGYLQGPAGTLAVRIAGTESDRLAVDGPAVPGGSVSISELRGPVVLDTPYVILTSTGLRGRFAGVSSDFAFLDPDLAYSPFNVSALLRRNAVAFSSLAATFNQFSTAVALDGLDRSRLLYRSVVSLREAEARTAFDALSGEIHASTKSVLIEDSSHVRDAANGRLRAATSDRPATRFMSYNPAGSPASTRDGFAFWGDGYGTWGDLDADGNAARVERKSGGFLIGGDAPIAATWRLGALAGYSQSTFDVDARRSSGTSDNYHIGVYGGGEAGWLLVRAGAFYSAHDIGTNRTILFDGFADHASADYRAHTLQAFGEIGYRWSGATTAIEPYLNLAHVRFTNDGFAESANEAAVIAATKSTPVTFTTLGMRGTVDFDVGSRMTLTAGVGWRHAFDIDRVTSTLSFGPAPFAVAGAPIAKNAAVVDANLDFHITDSAVVGVSYNGQVASDAQEHAVAAKLAVSF
jgi:outer membrane autotransporter protein